MNTHRPQSRAAEAAASRPSSPGSVDGQALEAARAEFRAAWEAKQARAGRIRARARNAERVRTWSARIGVLIVFVSGGVLALGLGNGAGFWEVVRTVPYLPLVWSYLACSVICVCAWALRVCLQRFADRLEASEVRSP